MERDATLDRENAFSEFYDLGRIYTVLITSNYLEGEDIAMYMALMR